MTWLTAIPKGLGKIPIAWSKCTEYPGESKNPFGVYMKIGKLLLTPLVPCFALILAGCGGPWFWIPRPPISFADLSGAQALGIVESVSPRAIGDEDDGYDRLYKLLTDGSWTEVEFRNERGIRADIPVDLLHLERLNEQFFVLVFGSRDDHFDDVWSEPYEWWSDTFLLDGESGNMYYLNRIADAGTDESGTTHQYPSQIFSSDDAGGLYYIGGPLSSDRFSNEFEQIRDSNGVIQLSYSPEDETLTGEFITSNAVWVGSLFVTGNGDLLYSYGAEVMMESEGYAFRTGDGEVGFLGDFISLDSWSARFFEGSDGKIYFLNDISTEAGDPVMPEWETSTLLYELSFSDGTPTTEEVATIFTADSYDSAGNLSRHLVTDEYVLFVGHWGVSQFMYGGVVRRISYPVEIGAGPTVLTSDRHLFVLNAGYSMTAGEDNETTFAIVVDLQEQTAIEFPLDRQRYTINEFRNYPAEPDAVYASLTDVLTGTTSSYALYPDGTMELLSEEQEETLIITIEPL